MGGARRHMPWGDFRGRGQGRGRAVGGRGNVFRREDHQERPKEEQNNETPQNEDNHQVRGVINTISGGFARGGMTGSVRKRHL